jgi:hypothetical protein
MSFLMLPVILLRRFRTFSQSCLEPTVPEMSYCSTQAAIAFLRAAHSTSRATPTVTDICCAKPSPGICFWRFVFSQITWT